MTPNRCPNRHAVGRALLLCLSPLTVLGPRTAYATYSIVAADEATGQVGATATSCYGSDIAFVNRLVPGQGAVVAQAYFYERGRDEAFSLLKRGLRPEGIISAITAPTFDHDAATRQYGVVALNAPSATYTGQKTDGAALGRTGSQGTFTYSIQGNYLTGPAVVDQAAAGFESGGCDLADRLMAALEQGAVGRQGDRRCTPAGVPANSAFIAVDDPTGASGQYLRLSVSYPGAEDAVARLREAFAAWRSSHPCRAASLSGQPTRPWQGSSSFRILLPFSGAAFVVLAGLLIRRWRTRSLRTR